MKKTTAGLVLTTAVCLLLCSCSIEGGFTDEGYISEELGINVAVGDVAEYSDTHGGFHGDGELYAEITFSDDSVEQEILKSEDWKSYPDKTVSSVVEIFDDSDDLHSLPDITNGYYYLENRSDETDDVTKIMSGSSFNFTLAIYDADNEVMYYYELDT